jgi:predicted DNA-binding antitoxin AbrB/MazE fold protein
MTLTVDAIYENGLLKPKEQLALAEGAEVRLTIEAPEEDHDPLDEVIGICTEGPEISLAERHDDIVYGGLLSERSKQP